MSSRVHKAFLGFGYLLSLGAGIAAAFFLFIYCSGLGLSFLARIAQNPVSPFVPPFFETESSGVKMESGEYTSSYDNAYYDLYYPGDLEDDEKVPVIFWMHGGYFIVGDRTSLKVYGTHFAAHGFAFVSLDYALAPETTYPAPVVQYSEAVHYFINNAKLFPMCDFTKIAIGGDSTGAQIAAQYLTVESNPELATEMRIPRLADQSRIKAALLYCGPYDIALINDYSGDNVFGRIFAGIGWAYFGIKDWDAGDLKQQVDVVSNTTAAFAPAFITDGNSYSFKNHAEELVDSLTALHVPYVTYYPDETNPDGLDDNMYNHEYQFDWEKYPEASDECFARALAFVQERMAPIL